MILRRVVTLKHQIHHCSPGHHVTCLCCLCSGTGEHRPAAMSRGVQRKIWRRNAPADGQRCVQLSGRGQEQERTRRGRLAGIQRVRHVHSRCKCGAVSCFDDVFMVISGEVTITSDCLSCRSLKIKVVDLLLHRLKQSRSALWTGAKYSTTCEIIWKRFLILSAN